MAVSEAAPPRGFVPIRTRLEAGELSWCHDDDREFVEPFFDESIRRCLRRPFNRAFLWRTPIAALLDFVRREPCRAPDGFIFHLSRCGSTLLAQMFTSLPATRVISEALPIDRVLHADRSVPGLRADIHLEWLRATVLAYGAGARAPYARYVVKLDAWNIHRLGLLRQAFPAVPWLFLFRDPLEVLVSNVQLRAASTLPGTGGHAPAGLDLASALAMSDEEYLGRILQGHMRAALAQSGDPLGLYIDYRDLPARALPRILAHFGMRLGAEGIAAMLAKAGSDAKQPDRPFAADGERKRASASALAREVAAQLLQADHRALCELSAGQLSAS